MTKLGCLVLVLLGIISAARAESPTTDTFCDSQYQSVLDAQEWLSREKSQADPDRFPGDPNPAVERFARKASRFLHLCPEDARFTPVAYKQGKLLYDHNRFAKARKVLGALINKHPEDEKAGFAAHLVLDSLNLEKNYQGLENAIRTYLANGRLMQRGDLKEFLLQILPAVMHKRANDRFERAGKTVQFHTLAETYLALVDEFPAWKYADEVLTNAAICYERSHQLAAAARVYRRLLREYPESSLAKRARERLQLFPP